MANATIDRAARAVGWGTLGFGVLGALSPGTLRKAYGDPTSSGAALDYFGRTWGTRTAVLGAMTLMASSDAELKRISTLAAVMTAMDSLIGFRAGGLPAVTKNMAGVTSAGFSAGSAYIAMNL